MKKKKTLFRILSHSEKETESAGMLLASQLKGMATILAPDYDVSSPTYTIVNEYGEGDRRLCHFDMYRIDSEDDLESIGFYDYTDCVIVAEWCEKIPFALPEIYFSVTIEKLNEAERLIASDVVEGEV